MFIANRSCHFNCKQNSAKKRRMYKVRCPLSILVDHDTLTVNNIQQEDIAEYVKCQRFITK